MHCGVLFGSAKQNGAAIAPIGDARNTAAAMVILIIWNPY
jgi:hypothetical protein